MYLERVSEELHYVIELGAHCAVFNGFDGRHSGVSYLTDKNAPSSRPDADALTPTQLSKRVVFTAVIFCVSAATVASMLTRQL